MSWQEDVARARWRADLLELGAEGHRSFGDNVNADSKADQAELERDYAAAIEKFETARGDLKAKSPEFRAAAQELFEERSRIRRAKADLGIGPVSVANNFSEPTAQELGVKS
jgi:hypothetical protein